MIQDLTKRRAYAVLLNAQGSHWLNESMKALHTATMLSDQSNVRDFKRQARACLQYATQDRKLAQQKGWKLP